MVIENDGLEPKRHDSRALPILQNSRNTTPSEFHLWATTSPCSSEGDHAPKSPRPSGERVRVRGKQHSLHRNAIKPGPMRVSVDKCTKTMRPTGERDPIGIEQVGLGFYGVGEPVVGVEINLHSRPGNLNGWLR